MPMYSPASVPLWLSPERIVIGGASGGGRFGAATAALALDAPSALAAAGGAPAAAEAGVAPPPAGGGAAGARDGGLHASARSKAPSAPQRAHAYVMCASLLRRPRRPRSKSTRLKLPSSAPDRG